MSYPDSRHEKAKLYFNSLSNSAKNTISIPRVSTHLGCSYNEAKALLDEYVRNGKLLKREVLCCSECGHLIKVLDLDESTEGIECVHCGAQMEDGGHKDVRYAFIDGVDLT